MSIILQIAAAVLLLLGSGLVIGACYYLAPPEDTGRVSNGWLRAQERIAPQGHRGGR